MISQVVTKYCIVEHVCMHMDFASFSKQTCSRHALRSVCIPNYLEALKGLQTIALKFQRSNAEGIALSMKTRYYVICFQHLFSAMLHLYSPVISLLLSPIHPKSKPHYILNPIAMNSTRAQKQPRGLIFHLKVFRELLYRPKCSFSHFLTCI